MNQKALIVVATLALLIGGAVWIWNKNKGDQRGIIKDAEMVSLTQVLSDKTLAEEYAETWNGDTSQWRVYRNEEARIEIKYPEEIFSSWESKTNSLSVDPTPRPDEFHFELRQKGYSVDDYKHKIWISLNSLRSEKEYYSEKEQDTVVIEVPIGKKTAKIFTTKERASVAESNYKDFLDKGICDPETFTVIFDDTQHLTGDFRSYAHVGCEGEAMGKVYQTVFHSISFLDK